MGLLDLSSPVTRFIFVSLLLSLGSGFLIYFVWTTGIYVIKPAGKKEARPALLVVSWVLFIIAFLLGQPIINPIKPPFGIIFAAVLIIVASLVAIIAKRRI
jgi:hypothetical protein